MTPTPQTFEQLAEKEYPIIKDYSNAESWNDLELLLETNNENAIARPAFIKGLSLAMPLVEALEDFANNYDHDNSIRKEHHPENCRVCSAQAAVASFPSIGKEDDGWISVEDKPLVDWDINDNGQRAWTTTNAGDKEFFAAVPYKDKRQPGKELWWIRYCVIDHSGLCVIGDEDNDPAGWEIEHVTHYISFPLPSPPSKTKL